MDILERLLWISVFLVPALLFVLVLRRKEPPLRWRIALRTLIAVGSCAVLFCIALMVIFRNGMGP